jgi:hypothetical protein
MRSSKRGQSCQQRSPKADHIQEYFMLSGVDAFLLKLVGYSGPYSFGTSGQREQSYGMCSRGGLALKTRLLRRRVRVGRRSARFTY